jgi:3-hydroxy-3-methylglutaryl CoA synthase
VKGRLAAEQLDSLLENDNGAGAVHVIISVQKNALALLDRLAQIAAYQAQWRSDLSRFDEVLKTLDA